MKSNKYKVIFFTMPLYGHITPILLTLKSLTEKGYEIYCVGAPKHFSLLELYGAKCIAYHPKILKSFEMEVKRTKNVRSHFLAMFTRDNLEWNIANGKELYEFACETLEPTMKDLSPDFVLYDSTAVWGLLLGKRHQLPCIDIESATDMEEITDVYRGFYEKVVLREIKTDMEYGNYDLGPDEEIIPADEYLEYSQRLTWKLNKKANRLAGAQGNQLVVPDMKFAYVIQSAYESYASKLEHVQFCGFGCEVPPVLDKKDGIFVTQGTVTDPYSMRLLIHISKALFPCGQKVTVTTGSELYYDEVKEELREAPANINISSFVNQLDVLSSHKVMISHGGLSGIREAILCETPVIVFPVNYHCYQSALAVERLGIGIWLKERGLAQGDSKELLKAVQEVLFDPRYVERIKEVKKEFLEEYKQNKVLKYLDTLVQSNTERREL